jgi:glycopeptide antibiotics resistance protein
MPSPLDNSRPNDTAKETEMDTISSNGSGTNLTMIRSLCIYIYIYCTVIFVIFKINTFLELIQIYQES